MPPSDPRLLSLKATAYHEAGQTVAALVLGITFSKVWILNRKETDTFPDGVNIGEMTRPEPIHKPKFAGKLEEAKVEAIESFAGPIAEVLPWPDLKPNWHLNDNDFQLARSFLRFALLPFELKNGEIRIFSLATFSEPSPRSHRSWQTCSEGREDRAGKQVSY